MSNDDAPLREPQTPSEYLSMLDERLLRVEALLAARYMDEGAKARLSALTRSNSPRADVEKVETDVALYSKQHEEAALRFINRFEELIALITAAEERDPG